MTDSLVILVGHCFADSLGLKRMVGKALGSATIERANNDKALEKILTGAGDRDVLLLVNRALDGRFTATDGIGIIADHAKEGVRAILVSNYPDAQDAAVAAGAERGFGKSNLSSPEAHENLRAAASRD